MKNQNNQSIKCKVKIVESLHYNIYYWSCIEQFNWKNIIILEIIHDGKIICYQLLIRNHQQIVVAA